MHQPTYQCYRAIKSDLKCECVFSGTLSCGGPYPSESYERRLTLAQQDLTITHNKCASRVGIGREQHEHRIGFIIVFTYPSTVPISIAVAVAIAASASDV